VDLLYFCSFMSIFFSLNIVIFLVGFSFFPCICRRCLCVFIHLLHLSLSVYFGCAGSVGVFLACRVIFLSAWGSAVWSVGPVHFI
jgi:hypothetical protein